jgi:hypothetical protein
VENAVGARTRRLLSRELAETGRERKRGKKRKKEE